MAYALAVHVTTHGGHTERAKTPPSVACSARRARAAASRPASTADLDGFTDHKPQREQGHPWGRTREEKRPHHFTVPCDARPARLSSFRRLAVPSPHWMLVGTYGDDRTREEL